MMTFIIFDTVMQIFADKKDEKKRYQIRYAYNSLNIQIDYFKEQEKKDNKFVGKMNFKANYILKECKREIKKFEKLKRKQKKHNIIYDRYVYQLSCWESLRDSIVFLICKKNSYSVEEYLEILKKARNSMVQCRLL